MEAFDGSWGELGRWLLVSSAVGAGVIGLTLLVAAVSLVSDRAARPSGRSTISGFLVGRVQRRSSWGSAAGAHQCSDSDVCPTRVVMPDGSPGLCCRAGTMALVDPVTCPVACEGSPCLSH